MKLCLALRTSYMPPIHMPACPVSASTIASSGTWRESSAQMRSGRIGAASDSSIARYFARHSSQIFLTCCSQGERLGELHELRAGARGTHAAAGDDHRPFGPLQLVQ